MTNLSLNSQNRLFFYSVIGLFIHWKEYQESIQLFRGYYIRGVSEKYPICVHIPALVLFFVIRTVASFGVVPIWLNHTLPAVFPYLKAVLERRFWNGLQLARRITLNRLDVVGPLSFERHFQFWEHPKVAASYVGTVQKLAKLYNLVFRQILLHKVRWMRWRVIVVKKPVTAWPETRSFTSYGITQFFQNFNVIFRRSTDLLERIHSAQHPHNRKK